MNIPSFLEGAADIHVHSSPDVEERKYDDIDLAREAARARMSAILLKSHQNSTVERSILVSKIVPEIHVLGGLVLNETVGGLNPAAVRLALKLGAKQIWMPTRSAQNHLNAHGLDGPGITILDAQGAIVPVVDRILELVAQADCMLGTGHLSPEESCALIARARNHGVQRIVVTHPEWRATYFPIGLQRELAGDDHVFFERCFVSTTHRCGFTPIKAIADAIAEVGVDRTVLSTDLGQIDTPAPVQGLKEYADALRSFGFSVDDLRRMMVGNPLRLLKLSDNGQ